MLSTCHQRRLLGAPLPTCQAGIAQGGRVDHLPLEFAPYPFTREKGTGGALSAGRGYFQGIHRPRSRTRPGGVCQGGHGLPGAGVLLQITQSVTFLQNLDGGYPSSLFVDFNDVVPNEFLNFFSLDIVGYFAVSQCGMVVR